MIIEFLLQVAAVVFAALIVIAAANYIIDLVLF